jgi:hypothetical protein
MSLTQTSYAGEGNSSRQPAFVWRSWDGCCCSLLDAVVDVALPHRRDAVASFRRVRFTNLHVNYAMMRHPGGMLQQGLPT